MDSSISKVLGTLEHFGEARIKNDALLVILKKAESDARVNKGKRK